MLFNWLRSKVRNAVLEGINDAVELLEQENPDAPAVIPPALAARLALTGAGTVPALPAPTPPADPVQAAVEEPPVEEPASTSSPKPRSRKAAVASV